MLHSLGTITEPMQVDGFGAFRLVSLGIDG